MILDNHMGDGVSRYLLGGIAIVTLPILTMGLARLLGHARTSFHHAPSPLSLRTKDGKTVPFPELCKAAIPPCRLNPFLFNGHLQTMWTAIKSQDVPIYYKRRVFDSDHAAYAGTFAVDFVTPPYDDDGGGAGADDPALPPRTKYYTDGEFEQVGASDARPMLVVLHGLSGGSHEIYLRHVLAVLTGDIGGWEACVVNSRGCAKSKITSNVLYNARATWDVRQMVKWLRKQFPSRPLFGIGFSLGANILTNVCTASK